MRDRPDWHPEDVKAAIRKTGTTCSALSEKFGYHKSCIRIALHRPWPKLEALIARHLNRTPWVIWPSRYDENCKPIKGPAGRPRLRSSRAQSVAHRKSGGMA